MWEQHSNKIFGGYHFRSRRKEPIEWRHTKFHVSVCAIRNHDTR